MSGGALNYAYRHIDPDFALDGLEELRERGYPLTYEYVSAQCRRLARVLHDVEWELSGDGGWPPELTDEQVYLRLFQAMEGRADGTEG